tara:strand:- start:1719 stop:2363 length:645 start_codon:yes stop_codon:yes gene_type:complete
MPSWCIDLLLLLGGAVDDRHQLGVAAGDRGAPGDKRASYVAGRYDDIIGVAERDRVEPEQFRGSRATPAWPERVRTRRGWCQPDATTLAGRHTGVDVRHGEATALPFESGSFDAVVCFTMLHHLPSAAAQERLCAQARVVRSNGLFLRARTADGVPCSRSHTSATPARWSTRRNCRQGWTLAGSVASTRRLDGTRSGSVLKPADDDCRPCGSTA